MVLPILFLCLVFASGCGKDEESPNVAEQKLEQMLSQNAQIVDSLVQDSVSALGDLPEDVVASSSVETSPISLNFDPRGKYLLQVGAYQKESAAKETAENLKKMGYPAQVVSGNGIFRVRIGFFKGVSQAKAMGEKLKSELGLDYWVANR